VKSLTTRMTAFQRYCAGTSELYTEVLQTPSTDGLFGTGSVEFVERNTQPLPGASPLLTPVTRIVAGSQVKPFVFEPPTGR